MATFDERLQNILDHKYAEDRSPMVAALCEIARQIYDLKRAIQAAARKPKTPKGKRP